MKAIAFAVLTLVALSAFADEYVQPYVRSDGTFVPGHYRSSPDGNPYNNYSTQGNVNPYTGKAGTVNPYAYPQPQPTPMPNPYAQPRKCGYNYLGQYVCI